MAQSRRTFLKRGGIGLLTFWVSGCERELTPGEARAKALPLQVFEPADSRTLEALGDTLLPGSAQAGLAHYIDHQLAAPPGEQMLMIKYLGMDAPFDAFYRDGLSAMDAAARAEHGESFAALDAERSQALVERLSRNDVTGWAGPPAPLFYFVLRNDAIDVFYGTEAGFERLGIPYRAHIAPPSPWGA